MPILRRVREVIEILGFWVVALISFIALPFLGLFFFVGMMVFTERLDNGDIK